MRKLLSFVALTVLTACGSPKGNAAAGTSAPEWKPQTEFGPLKLGMLYDDAIAAIPEAHWNSAALAECADDLPLKGCFISQYGTLYSYRLDGLAFSPQLEFNKHGILTDTHLGYSHEGSITAAECQSLYARTVDYTANTYGPLAFPHAPKDGKDYPAKVYKSPAGVEYPVAASPDAQFFVAGAVRGNLDGTNLPTSIPLTKWNNLPYVVVSALFSASGRTPDCRITLSFSLPESVERRRS